MGQWGFDHGYPKEVQHRYLVEMQKYADFHFCCEENYMLINRYARFDTHKAEHVKLMNILQMKMAEFARGSEDKESIVKFCFMWLISHTTEEDKKLGQFMGAKTGGT